MTKNCWNSQALAEISCYLAFAGAMLYLVRSGRYLSYVLPNTEKLRLRMAEIEGELSALQEILLH